MERFSEAPGESFKGAAGNILSGIERMAFFQKEKSRLIKFDFPTPFKKHAQLRWSMLSCPINQTFD
jgi:hypothetical protein